MTTLPVGSSVRTTASAYSRVLLEPARLLRGYAVLIGALSVVTFLWKFSGIAREIGLAFGVSREAVPVLAVALLLLSGAAWASADRADPRQGALAVAYLQVLAVMSLSLSPLALGAPALGPGSLALVLSALLFAYVGGDALPWAPGVRRRGAHASSRDRRIRDAARREERERLARDLHDAVKQQLFVVRTAAATAQQRLRHGDAGVESALQDVRRSARDAIAELEVLLSGLRSAPVTAAGLTDAIRQHGEALEHRRGARVTIEHDPPPADPRLRSDALEAVFRIAQEALSNVSRHARAQDVRIRLTWQDDALVLSISDNGPGFEVSAAHAGLGIVNMQARASAAGGSLDIASEPGVGTTVIARVPRLPARVPARQPWSVLLGIFSILWVFALLGFSQRRHALPLAVLFLPHLLYLVGMLGAHNRRRLEVRS